MKKYQPYGRNVRNNKKPVSVCDHTGLFFNTFDMVKQMEYRGNKLMWTGLMVGESESDKPNPQNLPFKPKKELQPIKNLRVEQYNPPLNFKPAPPALSLTENLKQIEGIFSQ